ncbi:hypothetical protein BJY04DRAFT_211238 [Aspergillus karnatakaensis]|uniref:uncharacterized protein n=1 Tax=Aspergillus karnatakaensis TaxID=1810916 RepID=UPI003CCDDECE
MAQPFYPTEEELGFDLQSKTDPLPIPHTLDSQQDTQDRNIPCVNPGVETETKGRGQTRRRIQVACQRCRKRKIKCSGDVNSSIVQTKPQSAPGWPYPSNDMVPQRPGAYATSIASKTPGLPTIVPNHRASLLPRTLDYEVSADTQSAYHRQAFSIDSAVSYDDESLSPYTVQPTTAYMLPGSPQVFLPEYCWNPKSWGSMLQAGRPPPGTIFSETDAENPLQNPAYSYMIPGQGSQTNEALSTAPIPSSLTSSAQGTERTLPNPASRSSFSGNTNGSTTGADPISISGLPSGLDFKAAVRWGSKCEPRTPMTPCSNVPFNTAPIERVRLFPSSGQDMLGFLPIASSSATAPLLPASAAFTGLEAAACATEADDEFRGNADSRIRTFSHNSSRGMMSSLTDYRASTYGYSRPTYRNRSEAGDSNSESTLITGLPYTRPTHSIPLPQMDEKIAPQTMAAHVPFTAGLCSQ